MSFTSPAFLLFLPAVLLLYRLLKRKYRLPLLLISSYTFYACYDVRLLALILIATFVSYCSARFMEQTSNENRRKAAVVITAFICLGILFFFKYLNFTLYGIFSILKLFGIQTSYQSFDILLPMGISFYIFQTMSYSFDVYHRKTLVEKNLGFYALFVVFFPQLVAGPIERPGDLLPQLKSMPTPDFQDCMKGLHLLIRGYAKKILIADFLAGFVTTAYDHIDTAGGAALCAATFLFAIQIYCDFSGYSDIALGCAAFMGIKLSQNFNAPYTAVSIRDFWRRWHISLTRWFTDYLYIPLGGNRKGLLLQCRNILITFLASGLWHGANLTYVAWGFIHGLYLMIETLFCKKETSPARFIPLRKCITFLLVCFAWIFFRAATITDALHILQNIFTDFQFRHFFTGLGMNHTEFLLVLLLLLLFPSIDRLPAIETGEKSSETKQIHTLFLYVLLAFCIIICRCLLLISHGATSFIYFQF